MQSINPGQPEKNDNRMQRFAAAYPNGVSLEDTDALEEEHVSWDRSIVGPYNVDTTPPRD